MRLERRQCIPDIMYSFGRKGERHWCEREVLIGSFLYVPQLGIQPIHRSPLKAEVVMVGVKLLKQTEGGKFPPLDGPIKVRTQIQQESLYNPQKGYSQNIWIRRSVSVPWGHSVLERDENC